MSSAFPHNLHNLFRNREIGYVTQIKPTQEQKELLEKCQSLIRATLTPVIQAYTLKKAGISIKPKYRIQGSWAYGTCNQPAQDSQEMDMDYGLYIPNSIYGEQRSDLCAKELFRIVEAALEVLATQQHWELDKSKKTCARLKVTTWAHVDVPLYAVPDKMFDGFAENHGLMMDSIQKAEANRRFRMDNHGWALNESKAKVIELQNITTIHMAQRDGGWKDSDCEKVRKWFEETLAQQADKGRQLRYVVRYLKAWRDEQWASGGPTSILLMIIAAQRYQFFEARDDLALHHVTRTLASSLQNDVFEPNIDGHKDENFNGKYSSTEMEMHASNAHHFHVQVELALTTQPGILAIEHLQESLGERIPNEPTLIELNKPTSSLAAHLLQETQRSPAQPTPRQVLRPQQGG